MAYIGAPPLNRVLSSADIAQGAVTLDDINFTDQPVNMDITGVIDKHTMRLADGVTITGDVTISDDLVLSKISDDGNAITMTNDGSSRTITGSGSIEASTLSQTPNQSLTGMTGTVGSAVTGGAGLSVTGMTGVIGSAVTGSPALNLENATFPAGHTIQTIIAHSETPVHCAGNTYTLITNMAGVITPKKSNSKIIIHMEMGGRLKAEAWGDIKIKITGTTTGTVMENVQYANSSVNDSLYLPFPVSVLAVDTPGTIAQQTYQLHVRTGGDGTLSDFTMNVGGEAGTNPATIIITEIAQ